MHLVKELEKSRVIVIEKNLLNPIKRFCQPLITYNISSGESLKAILFKIRCNLSSFILTAAVLANAARQEKKKKFKSRKTLSLFTLMRM